MIVHNYYVDDDTGLQRPVGREYVPVPFVHEYAIIKSDDEIEYVGNYTMRFNRPYDLYITCCICTCMVCCLCIITCLILGCIGLEKMRDI